MYLLHHTHLLRGKSKDVLHCTLIKIFSWFFLKIIYCKFHFIEKNDNTSSKTGPKINFITSLNGSKTSNSLFSLKLSSTLWFKHGIAKLHCDGRVVTILPDRNLSYAHYILFPSVSFCIWTLRFESFSKCSARVKSVSLYQEEWSGFQSSNTIILRKMPARHVWLKK